MQDALKNAFPSDEKVKLAVAGVSENGLENQFPLAIK